MNDKYEKVIRGQDEWITCPEKQHAASQKLIDSQKQQIQALEEKISVLEKENRTLASAGNEMSAVCEKLEKLVESFRSGEKYTQLEKAYQKIIDSLKREIRQLKAELAAAHAETVNVRNQWFQTCEDVIKEKEAALARKDREVKKAREAMYRAQKQCDEAMEKLRKKGQELYEVKTQLEEERGKNRALTARVNRDYTNSSKSPSQSPNHKKIHNGRKKTGRKPGGQPGHPHHKRKRQEPDRTVEIPAPEELISSGEYRQTGKIIRRQMVILHVSTEVVEYATPEFVSKITGKKTHAPFPDYGNRHQECLVHVERYLRSSIENEPPSEYFRKGYNLYQRMSKDREDYLLFLYDSTIPPTNNAAENAARKYKRKNAQTMC